MSKVIRMIPYPPSFSSRAARSIDPAIGASTWALGSHRWRPYRGALTMNATRRARLDIKFDHWVVGFGGVNLRIGRWRVPILECRNRMAISRGSELIRV